MPDSRVIRQPLYAWLTLAAGLLLTFFFATLAKDLAEEDAIDHFSFAADQVTVKIDERLRAYALVLRGGAALFDASEEVTRDEWRAFTDKLSASETVVGIQGIGFSLLIRPEELEDHITRIRAEGFPEYQVWPAGERELYSAIVYLEPFRGRNLRAFGYDMFSEPVRRAAMIQARDTGMAALSGRVELVQETGTGVQPGTLMYVPVYRQGAAWGTLEERREALIGWSYSPYRMYDLMGGILGNDHQHLNGQAVGLSIYDGEARPENLLYRNFESALDTGPSLFFRQRVIDFNDRQWTLHFDHLDPSSGIDYTSAWATLAGGLVLSGLLFSLLLSMANTQARALRIADQLTVDIRDREARLSDSEYRWRFALEGAGDGVWDWNLEDNTVYFSRRWKSMLGFEDQEIGQGLDEWQRRVHPDDLDSTLAELKGYLNGDRGEYVSEHRMRCKDGSWKWILDRGMVVSRDGQGRPLRMIGTHTDISGQKALEAAREEILARLQTITSRVPGVVYEFRLQADGRSCFPYASEAIRQIYRVSPEEVKTDASAVFAILHPDDYDAVVESIQHSARHLTPWRHEYRVKFPDGTVRWLYGDSLPHREPDGSTLWYGFITDITERKEAEAALRKAHSETQRFREALDYVSSFIYMKDTQSRYTYANRATLELFGTNDHDLPGSDDFRFFSDSTAHRLREIDRHVFLGEQTSEEIEAVDPGGHRRVYLEIKTPIYDETERDEVIGLLGISTDITAIKEHERQLEHIAHFDALTNLPNRVLLADRLHQAMAQAVRRGHHLAVAYLDLDGFKAINDRYGHAVGDKLLMAVAQQMHEVLREEDTLSRLGGDEFVAVLLDLADVEACVPLLTRLLAAAARPVSIEGRELRISASLGVTFYPQAEQIEAEQLLRQADQAMYQAKLAGKGRYHVFDAELDRSVRTHHESLERIRSAFENDEFVLHYQPKVNMRSGAVIGAEALIRWQHPDKGLLPPGDFLPVIEDHPLAIELGEWVITRALQQMASWQTAGLVLPVSVNIGASQLRQDTFVSRLRTLLDGFPEISPGSLELEILETSALGDLALVTRLLDQCRAIGVNIALDDFGTGYSSLTYLKRLPAGVVKVDQSFIRDILMDPEDLAILDGVLGLAGAFNRQVIAEGVETVEHGDMLLRIGCELAQGYGIARPMPAEALHDWVKRWRPEPHWPRLRRISRELMPLLHAGVEHRAWLEDLDRALRSGSSDFPPLGPHQCRFGTWLDQLGDQLQPGFGQIDLLHRQVHALAAELIELHERGDAAQVIARLDELHALSERLLEALRNYLD
ncbi:diguanylate cyclase/phosphodiesterase with PAS/PAC and Chase sensor(s) [Thioalkalivibrio sulfidiphilus HL-EbGr7]|uniref:Diguanylate cyclase/phosphodiesterase with PAS/PAC and Chase sensor(S) n=1 Tax=Thioalkalivibrio sulfidiphilus (strain HL-EbGR7) TaxID=396588 RepID=B8GSM8_THISH|nr:EAL domain-containing protein [Thioalkalivibrio sulfidiphilus]ACL72932.1 diguanylate cyclase/phosphodiesterase with PAS/PAC and Chase sensor(s) [Thioalkalivibrio sulfidiphilus HL-EbGr7]